jgi:hypothetical protein
MITYFSSQDKIFQYYICLKVGFWSSQEKAGHQNMDRNEEVWPYGVHPEYLCLL